MTVIALLDGPLNSRNIAKTELYPAEIHARAVVAAIKSMDPSAAILSFPVFQQRLTSSRSTVLACLEQAMQTEATLLHCSFGFSTADSETEYAFKQAVQHFKCVVASSPARGNPVYPATYPGVLKASGDARVKGEQLAWLNTQTVDVAAGAFPPDGFKIGGASIGAARVSGLVSRILKQVGSPVNIRQYLESIAVYSGPEVKIAE